MHIRNEFSTLDVVRILGITRGRIREWIDEGYIYPSIQESRGQGLKNVFSRWDFMELNYFEGL